MRAANADVARHGHVEGVNRTPTKPSSAGARRRFHPAVVVGSGRSAGNGANGNGAVGNGAARGEMRADIGKAVLNPDSIPALKPGRSLGRRAMRGERERLER